ncbi:hypothetical protein SMZ73_003918 [Cronobacter sakazakii]|nr:hypothetical protein [Cronobacter sakazakii]ELY4537310.1 hypothetical protein [Cronobacter sakazakii]
MDKSREQFLDWFSKEYEEVNNSAELSAQVIKMIASAAWQASRAAVEIEIPEVLDYWLGREGFAESIRAAGLKVKGE